MLVFVHSTVVYNLVDICKFKVEEAIVCEIKTKAGNSLYLCGVYRSPNSDDDNNKNINKLISWLSDKSFG